MDARACETRFNFHLCCAVHIFLVVAAIRANSAQAVTRSEVLAPTMVQEMQFSANQLVTGNVAKLR
jgi:hypothetical protein